MTLLYENSVGFGAASLPGTLIQRNLKKRIPVLVGASVPVTLRAPSLRSTIRDLHQTYSQM